MPSNSKVIKSAYRTRRGAFGTLKNSRKKSGVRLRPNAIPNHRHTVDVGQWDNKEKRLLNMRVTYALNPEQRRRLAKGPGPQPGVSCTGYKLTMPGGLAINDFRFLPGHKYVHKGKVQMCHSGFHFSLDALYVKVVTFSAP